MISLKDFSHLELIQEKPTLADLSYHLSINEKSANKLIEFIDENLDPLSFITTSNGIKNEVTIKLSNQKLLKLVSKNNLILGETLLTIYYNDNYQEIIIDENLSNNLKKFI